jgi:prevent-host-death family protein
VNIHEAKTHFSRLIDRVSKGEEITVARDGRPVAKIVPLSPRVTRRTLGTEKGRIKIRADFDAPLPKQIRKAFE